MRPGIVAVALIVSAGMMLIAAEQRLGVAASALLVDGVIIAMGLAMMTACWLRLRGSTIPGFWRALACAGASWAAARGVVAFSQTTHHQLPPLPSLADAFYLLFLLSMGLALRRVVHGEYGWRDLLDAGIVALALALLASLTRLADLVADVDRSAQTTVLAYMLGNITVLTLAFLLALRTPRESRAPVLLILAGLAGIAASDTRLIVHRLQGVFESGAVVDAARFGAFACILLVPFTSSRVRRVRPGAPGWPTVVFPTALAVGGVALVGYTAIGTPTWTHVQTALGSAMVGLMLLRATGMGLVDVRLRYAMLDAMERLRAVEAEKAIMLRAISHEIRNPLTPVALHAQMMGKRAPHLQPSVEVITRNVSQVERLAQDLNLIARGSEQAFDVSPGPCDVMSIARLVIEAETPNAAARGVRLDMEGDAAPAVADTERIEQVIGNLVRNALKFTPPGGRVEVRVSRARTVRVEVRDTGRGLAPGDLSRLFGLFVQVHDRRSQDPRDRGSGLGLYISKRLVEAHGGTIGVQSEGLGRGSTFWFELPPDPPQDPGDAS